MTLLLDDIMCFITNTILTLSGSHTPAILHKYKWMLGSFFVCLLVKDGPPPQQTTVRLRFICA